MGSASSEQKLAYARTIYKKGVTAPAKIQSLVKKKYGSGMNFRDLGKIFGKRKKTNRRSATRSGTAASRKKAGRTRRPSTSSAGGDRAPLLLLVGDDVELFGSRARLEARVGELFASGYGADEMHVYERTRMKLKVTTSLTL